MIFYAATCLRHLTAITYKMIGLNTIEYYENIKLTVPNITRTLKSIDRFYCFFLNYIFIMHNH